MYALDTSGSIRKVNFQIVKQFIVDLTEILDIDSGRVQVILKCAEL